jgi:hypothetical protein
LAAGLAVWYWWPAAPGKPNANSIAATEALPERTLSYYLTIQQRRKGQLEEYRATGEEETFPRSATFKLNISNPQTGFLYLLSAERAAKDAEALRLLYPRASDRNGLALLPAGKPLQTEAYSFTEAAAPERFLIVWSVQPAPALEAVRGVMNEQELGLISDPAQLAAVRAFLGQHPVEQFARQADSFSKLTTIRGRGDVLIAAVTLNHN